MIISVTVAFAAMVAAEIIARRVRRRIAGS
jgi:hypothetical protein